MHQQNVPDLTLVTAAAGAPKTLAISLVTFTAVGLVVLATSVLFVAVEELAQLPLEERVWRRLQLVARGYGSRDAPRRRIRLSQELLAQMLGVSRQSINKALKALEAGGRLRLHYGEIELLHFNLQAQPHA